MGASLEYDFESDRDGLMHLASVVRYIYCPISLFILLPLVFYVLILKTRMDLDCKIAFIAHNSILFFFDVYNCFFYQLYALLPYPVFCCTGILCNESFSPRLLLTGLAFFTIILCIPYLFLMMRIHQKMVVLTERSPFRLTNRSQALLMILFSFILLSNVYGFGAWSVESAEKEKILQIPSIAWATNQSDNCLVLGKQFGDIGIFVREMYLLPLSISVCFSFYIGITYHAVARIGKQAFTNPQKSRTYQLQLRFMASMSAEAAITFVMFVVPLVFLFLVLVFPIADFVPVMYSCCSIGHSTAFLARSDWCYQAFRRFAGPKVSSESATNFTTAVSRQTN